MPCTFHEGSMEATNASERKSGPFMYQTYVAPLEVLLQRMSGLPSALKSFGDAASGVTALGSAIVLATIAQLSTWGWSPPANASAPSGYASMPAQNNSP